MRWLIRWMVLLVQGPAPRCPQCRRPLERAEVEVDFLGFGRVYKRQRWRCGTCHYRCFTDRYSFIWME